MFLRRIGRVALAALGWACCCAQALPQTADSAPSNSAPRTFGSPRVPGRGSTGLLQLLSATEPVAAGMEADEAAPEPLAAEPVFPAIPPTETLQWIDPHQMGSAPAPCTPNGWRSHLPIGMDPWGLRTPLDSRAIGWGSPLQKTSWLNRPYSAGWFAGGISGPPLITGQVNQRGGFFGGYRAGWDYDYFWGLEARLAGSEIGLSQNPSSASPGTAGYLVLDASLHWYPWGDAAWRPYASLGLGLANIAFYNATQNRFDRTLLGLPLGVGLKYRFTDWFTLRADLMDNVAFGGGVVNTLNEFSLSGGVEVRFGGVRRSYWPWNPGRTIW
jgi:hypothetical protein